MNNRFLRDEAARFRAMAEDSDRATTKLRLLAIAVDYETRANAMDDLPEPILVNMDVPDKNEVVGVQTDPNVGKPGRVKLDRKNVRGLKETTLVERRPILHRR